MLLPAHYRVMEQVGRLESTQEARLRSAIALGNSYASFVLSTNFPRAPFNKLTSVFHASVLLLIINFVSSYGSADYFDNVMTKFIVNNRTNSLKTDINLFFTITNGRIARSHSLTRRTNFKFMCLSAY